MTMPVGPVGVGQATDYHRIIQPITIKEDLTVDVEGGARGRVCLPVGKVQTRD